MCHFGLRFPKGKLHSEDRFKNGVNEEIFLHGNPFSNTIKRPFEIHLVIDATHFTDKFTSEPSTQIILKPSLCHHQLNLSFVFICDDMTWGYQSDLSCCFFGGGVNLGLPATGSSVFRVLSGGVNLGLPPTGASAFRALSGGVNLG